ncbi:uncharacterized protein ACNLHF_014246 [Anomaloglossus baeobatrachus]
MRTLFIMTVFLILIWLTDASEGFSSNKMSKSRRAFFSKRSFLPGYEERTKHIIDCVINFCLSGMEDCTKICFTRHGFQFQDQVEKESLEIQCVILFANCAAKCMNNW